MKRITQYIGSIFSSILISASASASIDAVGTTTGVMTVSKVGEINYAVGLNVPSGVNGMQPTLGIVYSSSRSSGVVGLGAGISGLSSISRCSRSKYQDAQINHGGNVELGRHSSVSLNNDDNFCLDGQLLVLVSGSAGAVGAEYRTANETFRRIRITHGSSQSPLTLKVELPTGQIQLYGSTTDSQLLDSNGVVHSWYLSEVRDRFDNTVMYQYADFGTNGRLEKHISNINYGGTANINVQFDYEAKADASWGYRNGLPVSNSQRLLTVQTNVGSTIAKRYTVAYQETPVSNKSRIDTIQECAWSDAGEEHCVSPLVFDWNELSLTYADASTSSSTPDTLLDQAGRNRGRLLDINGDGLNDWLTSYQDGSGDVVAATWLGETDGSWAVSTDYAAPSPLYLHTGADSVAKLVSITDVDGDGLRDWVQAYSVNGVSAVYTWKNTGAGWETNNTVNETVTLPGPLYEVSQSGAARSIGQLLDLDRDARPDFVSGIRQTDGSEIRVAYLKTTEGWAESSSFQPDVMIDYAEHPLGAVAGRYLDINGDGLVDWVQSQRTVAGLEAQSVWLNNGSTWNKSNHYSNKLPSSLIDHAAEMSADGNVQLGRLSDVNGDGLVDWVEAYSHDDQATTNTWLNKGNGDWLSDSSYALPAALFEIDANGDRQSMSMLSDINGDGLKDLVLSYRSTTGVVDDAAWQNTGSGWLENESLESTAVLFQHRADAPALTEAVKGDITHNGLADVIQTQSSAWQVVSNEIGEDHAVRLLAVTDGFGLVKRVDYAVSSLGLNYEPSSPQTYPYAMSNGKRVLPFRIKSSNGKGGYHVSEHEFAGGISHRLKNASIFALHQSHNVDTGVTEVTNFNETEVGFGSVASMLTQFNGRTINKASNQYIERSFNSGKTRLTSISQSNLESRDDVGSGIGTLLHTKNQSFTYQDNQSTPEKVTLTTIETDALGSQYNVTNTIETELFSKQTADVWLAALPSSVTTEAQKNGSAAIIRKSLTTYTDEGKVDIQRQDPDQPLELKSDNDYDSHGNLETVTVSAPNDPSSPPARVVTTTYLSDGRFPDQMVNAQGHTSNSEYHPVHGLATETTDPNGIKANFYYDAFGRVENQSITAANADEQGEATNTNIATFKSCDNVDVCPSGAVYYIGVLNSENSPTPQTTFYDKFQRAVRAQTVGKGGAVIYTDTEYDFTVASASQAYRSTVRQSLPYFKLSSEPVNWVSKSSDALGREVQSITANGVFTQNSYQGRTVTRTVNPNESGYLRQVQTATSDPMGKPVLIVDAQLGELSYQYNALGSLLQTQDSEGVTTTHTVDNRGRPLSRNDPDLGLSTYVHNAFGNLIQKTDAMQQVFTYEYDKLDRLISRIEPDDLNSTNYESTWVYDQGNQAVGRLASLSDNRGFLKAVSYDTFGREESINQTVDGETHTADMAYYGNGGKTEWVNYSSGLSVRRTFDAFGAPEIISSKGFGNFQAYYDNLDLAQEKSDAAEALEATSSYQSTLSSLNSQKATKNSLITTYTNQRTTYNGQITTYNGQRTTYSGQATTYNGQVTTYNNQVTTYNNQRTTYSNQRTTYSNQRTTYTNDIARHTAARNQHKVYYDSWLAKYNQYIASSNTATSRANSYYASARTYQRAHDSQAATYNQTKQSAQHSLNLYNATGNYNHYIDYTNHNRNAANVWKEVLRYKGLTDTNNRSGNTQKAKAASDYSYAKNTALVNYNREVTNYNADNARRNTSVSNYNTATGRYNTAVSNYNTATGRYNTAVGNYNTALGRYNTAVSNYNTATGRYNTAVNNYNTANTNRNGAISDHDSLVDQINAHTLPLRNLQTAANDAIETANEMLTSYEAISEQHFESLEDNAFGQIVKFKLGGNIETVNTFDPRTALLTGISTRTGSDSTDIIQSDSYYWDTIGNLTNRTNNVAAIENGASLNLSETFTYDSLNRLKTSDLSGSAAQMYALYEIAQVSFDYSENGNLSYRSDVGTLKYEHATKAHAVTSVEKADDSIGYYNYDDNGNMITGPDGKLVDYASFDKPTTITTNQSTTTLTYGADRSLIKEVVTKVDGTTSTTLYFGAYQKVITQTSVKHRHTISGVDGKSIATINRVEGSSAETHYLHHDHLGSVVAVSDASGNVIGRHHFDAFGKRRNLIGQSLSSSANLASSITREGYTGHTELDSDLVYMNARVYDASLGRFLSADPVLPDAYDMQQYNRYSYVGNNPLRFTDPTGNFSVAVSFAFNPLLFVGIGQHQEFLFTPSNLFNDDGSFDFTIGGVRIRSDNLSDIVFAALATEEDEGEDNLEFVVTPEYQEGTRPILLIVSPSEAGFLPASTPTNLEIPIVLNAERLQAELPSLDRIILETGSDVNGSGAGFEHIRARHADGGAVAGDPNASSFFGAILSRDTPEVQFAINLGVLLNSSNLESVTQRPRNPRIALNFNFIGNSAIGVDRYRGPEIPINGFSVIIRETTTSGLFTIVTAFPNIEFDTFSNRRGPNSSRDRL